MLNWIFLNILQWLKSIYSRFGIFINILVALKTDASSMKWFQIEVQWEFNDRIIKFVRQSSVTWG